MYVHPYTCMGHFRRILHLTWDVTNCLKEGVQLFNKGGFQVWLKYALCVLSRHVQHIHMILYLHLYLYTYIFTYAPIYNYAIVILNDWFLQSNEIGIMWLSHIIMTKFAQSWGGEGGEEREGREKLRMNIFVWGDWRHLRDLYKTHI